MKKSGPNELSLEIQPNETDMVATAKLGGITLIWATLYNEPRYAAIHYMSSADPKVSYTTKLRRMRACAANILALDAHMSDAPPLRTVRIKNGAQFLKQQKLPRPHVVIACTTTVGLQRLLSHFRWRNGHSVKWYRIPWHDLCVIARNGEFVRAWQELHAGRRPS